MAIYEKRSISTKRVGMFRSKDLVIVRKDNDDPEVVSELYLKNKLFGMGISLKPCLYKDFLNYLFGENLHRVTAPDSIVVYSGYISAGSYAYLKKDFLISLVGEFKDLMDLHVTSLMSRGDFRIDKFFKVNLSIAFKPEPMIVINHKNFKDAKSRDILEVVGDLRPDTMNKLADALWDIIRVGFSEDTIKKEYYL